MSNGPVADLLNDLRVVFGIEGSRSDKIEERFRLMRPFEKRAGELWEPPEVPPGDRFGKILTLLWSKAHPDRAELDAILPQITDEDALVRATAVAVVEARFESQEPSDAPKKLDPASLYRLRRTLEQQRVRERFPALAFQLDQLIDDVKAAGHTHLEPERPKPANPYVAGPPVREKEKFFGRDGVLASIRKAIGLGSGTRGVVVYGGRRSGKTSLLYRLRDGDLGESFVPVYFDMQSVAGTGLGNFITSLVKALDDLPGDGAAPPQDVGTRLAGLPALRPAVRAALARIGGRSLVLMFDEFEVFQEYLRDADVARQLQSLLEDAPRLFFVFAGARKVESLEERNFAILFDNCKYMKISFLTQADSRRLITEPARGVLHYSDSVIERIQSLSAGHPFYTQAICQTLFDLLQSDNRQDVTIEDVEHAVAQFVENPAPHLVLGWNSLGLDEKIAASALASVQKTPARWVQPLELNAYLRAENYPVRMARGEMQEALSTLRDQDWTTKREGEREFRFTMDLVRRWIAEHKSIWELLEEQRRSLVERTATLGRRAAAFGIDLVFLGLLAALAEFAGVWPFSAAVVVYFVLFIALLQGTPGMRLMQVKAFTESGTRFKPLRSLPLSLSLAAPWLLFSVGIWLERAVVSPLLFLAAVAIVTLHAAMIHYGKKRRGLFDKVTRAVFVAESQV